MDNPIALLDSLRREHATKCQCHPDSSHANFHGDDPPECSCEWDPDESNATIDRLRTLLAGEGLPLCDEADALCAETRGWNPSGDPWVARARVLLPQLAADLRLSLAQSKAGAAVVEAARRWSAAKAIADKNPAAMLSSRMTGEEASRIMDAYFAAESELLIAVRALPEGA